MGTIRDHTGTLRRRRIEARITDEDIRGLDERARDSGIDRAECVGDILREALDVPGDSDPPRSHPTFAEIVAPIHQEFAKSGMTEPELLQLLEEAGEELQQDKQRVEAGA